MRLPSLSLVAVLIGGSLVGAQQTGGPVTPGLPATQPIASPADPKLDAHLAAWEKTMATVTNFRVDLALKRTDAVFKKDRHYSGSVLCMKPNLARLRLDYDGDPTKADYEAYICDGKSVYEYNGLQRTVTEWKLPNPAANPAGSTDNLMLDFLSGMKAKDAKQRFELTLFKEDEYYVYLDIKPLQARDKTEFQQLRLALYGPNTKFAYLPAQVFMVKPNGDTEQWSFKNPQTNLQGVDQKLFQYVKVPGFTERQGQPTPPPAPMVPTRPGGSSGSGIIKQS
jgi:TIGR03009 family protein